MNFLEKHRWPIIVALVLLIIIGAGVFSYIQTVLPSAAEITILPPSPEIYVYVEGEVVNPGVYLLKAGDRIADAIDAAGGFTEEAGQSAINLATLLRDRDQIHVFQVGDFPQKISINRAEMWLLEVLPGIGEILAQRIVEYRDANGPFQRIEDLMNVEGLGQSKFDKLKDLITVH